MLTAVMGHGTMLQAQLEAELDALKRLPRTAEVQKQAVEIMQELRSL